MSKTANTKQR
jgi:hypothetical protein